MCGPWGCYGRSHWFWMWHVHNKLKLESGTVARLPNHTQRKNIRLCRARVACGFYCDEGKSIIGIVENVSSGQEWMWWILRYWLYSRNNMAADHCGCTQNFSNEGLAHFVDNVRGTRVPFIPSGSWFPQYWMHDPCIRSRGRCKAKALPTRSRRRRGFRYWKRVII